MYLVTQTNVPAPVQLVVNSMDEAKLEAADLCPEPGDSAAIYEMRKVATVEAIHTVDIKEVEW